MASQQTPYRTTCHAPHRVRTLPILVLSLTDILPTLAAAHDHIDQPIFDCTTHDGAKHLFISANPPFAFYSFGPKHSPELSLSTPITDLDITPWNGVGMSIHERASFHNGAYTYTVYHDFDRSTHAKTAGVIITKDKDEIGHIPCDSGSIFVGLWQFYDLKTSTGQCWDDYTRVWKTACPKK